MARNNREEWADIYNRRVSDAFTVQDDLARQIASALSRQLRLGDADAVRATVASSGTANPEAYDLYLRGRYLLARRGRGVRQAAEKFQQAIARDSGFAQAHASFALSLELLVYFEPNPTDSIGRIALPAAERALAMDSTLADAYTALGLAHAHAYKWAAAESAFRRALDWAPDEAEAHIQYGRLLFYLGRLREAESEFRGARNLDVRSAVASGWWGHLLELRGRTDSAITELRRALEIDSTSPPALVMMAEAQQQRGDSASVRTYAYRLRDAVGLTNWTAAAAAMLAQIGDTARAHRLVRQLSVRPPNGLQHTVLAFLYLSLRDSTRALQSLERAAAAGEPFPTWSSMSERMVDPLRGSERFRRILRSVNLDDRIFMSPGGGRSR